MSKIATVWHNAEILLTELQITRDLSVDRLLVRELEKAAKACSNLVKRSKCLSCYCQSE